MVVPRTKTLAKTLLLPQWFKLVHGAWPEVHVVNKTNELAEEGEKKETKSQKKKKKRMSHLIFQQEIICLARFLFFDVCRQFCYLNRLAWIFGLFRDCWFLASLVLLVSVLQFKFFRASILQDHNIWLISLFCFEGEKNGILFTDSNL